MLEHLHDAIGVVEGALRRDDRLGERIAAVDRAEDRAAEAEDAGHVTRRQRPRLLGIDEAVEAVFEADDLDAGVVRGLDDGADDRVQAGSVAAAGEDSDFLHLRHGRRVRRPARGRVASHLEYSSRTGLSWLRPRYNDVVTADLRRQQT